MFSFQTSSIQESPSTTRTLRLRYRRRATSTPLQSHPPLAGYQLSPHPRRRSHMPAIFGLNHKRARSVEQARSPASPSRAHSLHPLLSTRLLVRYHSTFRVAMSEHCPLVPFPHLRHPSIPSPPERHHFALSLSQSRHLQPSPAFLLSRNHLQTLPVSRGRLLCPSRMREASWSVRRGKASPA